MYICTSCSNSCVSIAQTEANTYLAQTEANPFEQLIKLIRLYMTFQINTRSI